MNVVHTDKNGRGQQTGNVYPSVDALAEDLGLSRQSTYAALNNGIIPHIRVGKRFILPRTAIQDWLRAAGGVGV
jgi:excisionase family DNA binding protein